MEVADVLAASVVVAIPAAVIWYVWRWWTDPVRRNPDLCESCGYDLRGTPGRCPECGTADERHARFVQLERLRSGWPTVDVAVRRPRADEHRVIAREGFDRMLLDLLAQHLEARGVACEVEDAPLIDRLRPNGSFAYGTYKLLVWADDATRAAGIVKALLDDCAGVGEAADRGARA